MVAGLIFVHAERIVPEENKKEKLHVRSVVIALFVIIVVTMIVFCLVYYCFNL